MGCHHWRVASNVLTAAHRHNGIYCINIRKKKIRRTPRQTHDICFMLTIMDEASTETTHWPQPFLVYQVATKGRVAALIMPV